MNILIICILNATKINIWNNKKPPLGGAEEHKEKK
jgi:hypothetical protein